MLAKESKTSKRAQSPRELSGMRDKLLGGERGQSTLDVVELHRDPPGKTYRYGDSPWPTVSSWWIWNAKHIALLPSNS